MKIIWITLSALILFSFNVKSQTDVKSIENKTVKEHELLVQENDLLMQRVEALDNNVIEEDENSVVGVDNKQASENGDIVLYKNGDNMLEYSKDKDYSILAETEMKKEQEAIKKEREEKLRIEREKYEMMYEMKRIDEEEKMKNLEINNQK